MLLSEDDRQLAYEGYLAAAFWLSPEDPSDAIGYTKMEENHFFTDVAPGSQELIRAEVDAFLDAAGTDAERLLGEDLVPDASWIGHDIWLTRNHHGTGFWDRGYPDGIGERLTALAQGMGEVSLVLGDDGLIYQERG